MTSLNRNAQRGAATRANIVAVATRLFRELGYEGTSIEAVLEQTGISRGALYHHFPGGKESLFEAVLAAVGERVAERMAKATGGISDPAEALRAGCLGWLEIAATDPEVRRLVLLDAPAVLGWRRWREIDEQNTLGGIRASLRAIADADGGIKPDQIEMFSHILLATMNEVALLIAEAEDPKRAAREGSAAVEDFLDRLLGRRG